MQYILFTADDNIEYLVPTVNVLEYKAESDTQTIIKLIGGIDHVVDHSLEEVKRNLIQSNSTPHKTIINI